MGLFSRFNQFFLNSSASVPSTLLNPSDDLKLALMGIPAAAGKPVTRETALRVESFLACVNTIASDIAKMPLILRETTIEKGKDGQKGRQRTLPALDNPLYTLLKDCPNAYQTSYEMRWFLASQLIMNGNCYCQKITNQAGDVIALVPLNAWQMTTYFDTSVNPPALKFRYAHAGTSGITEFSQNQIWRVSRLNLEGIGVEGASVIMLAKEALSLLLAAEETAGKSFANGLSMSVVLSTPAGSELDMVQATDVIKNLNDNFRGSANAGRFTILPGGLDPKKIQWSPEESQLLDTRKFGAQEVCRVMGGAAMLVKLGYGEQNSTYASSSAFLDDYFTSALLPLTTAIEQSITRDLIPRKQWGTLYAKHSADIILRGSPKERADTNAVLINSGQLTPNEGRLLEDRDTIEGADYLTGPSGSYIYDPVNHEFFLPGQKPPSAADPDDANEETTAPDADEPDEAGDADGNTDPPVAPPAPAKPSKAKKRLNALAVSMADRVMRKEAKSTPDAKFTADVLNIDLAAAEAYVSNRSNLTDEQARTALIELAMGDHDED